MRLRRLELLRYGHLSDVALDFPPEAALCVVYGANEAGKSTALAAIADALFGFETRRKDRPRFDFQHSGSQLRVGVTLAAADGSEARFIRRGGRTATLRDAADAELPETALTRFLGGAGREQFETMFGLNGERLRAGGLALAQSGGGVGESLFAAGTGLHGVHELLEKLDKDAKALVGDGKGTRKLSEAVKLWKERQRDAVERAVPHRHWQDAVDAHMAATANLAAARDEIDALRIEAARLQRVRLVAPILAGLDTRRAMLEALAGVPRLPADAEERLKQARAAADLAARDAAREAGDAARLTAEHDALARAPAILAAQDAIDRLSERRAVIVQAEADLPSVRDEAERLGRAVAAAVADLGTGQTAEAAAEAVPPQAARQAVQRLVREDASLTAAAEAAARNRDAAVARRDAAERAVRAQPAPPDPALLRATIEKARGEGRLDHDLARAERALADAERAAGVALAALPLWSADAAALAACAVPLGPAAKTAGERLLSAETALAEADLAARAVTREIAEVEDTIAQIGRGEVVATVDAVRAARADRDAAWRVLRGVLLGDTAATPDVPTPDAYEALRDTADRLADRRADEAQRVADYTAATVRRDRLREHRVQAQAGREAAAATLTAARAAWRELWAPAGLAPDAPDAMTEWVRRRAEVLKLAASADDARRQHDDLRRRWAEARASLLPLLPSRADDDAALDALIMRADVACAAAEAAAAAHRARIETLAREEAALPALEQALEDNADRRAAWRAEWAPAVAAIGLPATATVAAAEAALAAWSRISEQAPRWRDSARRIAQMAGSIEEFAEAVAEAHAKAGLPPPSESAFVAAAGLARSLAEARQAEADAKALAERIAAHTRAAAEASARAATAALDLAALRALAGEVDDAELEAAIARARQRDTAETEVARLGAELAAKGEGRDEAALRAERALVADMDAAGARLTAIEERTAELGTRRETLVAESTRAETTLAALRKGRDAAGAAQEARDALATAVAAAERYARLHVARTLLRSGIERFRRAQQGPLLAAAGAHFAALTGRHYVRLSADRDAAGKAVLTAVRDDDSECPIEALSEGTRDQLYLALRIAAIEAHATHAEPLPFIADDLLVQFDDRRAAAALTLLAGLGRTAQVILFTHHDHVAALAEAHVGAPVTVLRLETRTAYVKDPSYALSSPR
jgi:uncharacterized protein YhaN